MVDIERMYHDTMIVINSSNRAADVCTHKYFPEEANWVVAVPADQVKEYCKHFHKKHVVVIPTNIPPYLSSQRQWVTEYCISGGWEYVWLMDDDLTFLWRDVEMKLKKITNQNMMRKLIESVFEHLLVVPMVGVSTRLGNNRITTAYDEINRVTRCYAMCTDTFTKVGATFAPFEPFLAQDFHMTLCWLNKGFPNRILYEFAQEDFGSNAEGGCSVYRTPELLKKVSMWMALHHPEVQIKVKKSKSWKGFGDKRVDMVCQWKQAYHPVKPKVRSRFGDKYKK